MARIIMVTGAQGTGKTTVAHAMAGELPGHVVFDMDSIIDHASALANRNINTRPEAWPTYNNLWLSILKAVCDNGFTPVLFTPIHPEELKVPDWCDQVTWIGLTCAETRLRERLVERNWEPGQIDEAVDDLVHTRDTVADLVDTSSATLADVCQTIKKLI